MGAAEPHESVKEFTSPYEGELKEKIPRWLAILIATILAIVVIWIMLIAIYPSIAL